MRKKETGSNSIISIIPKEIFHNLQAPNTFKSQAKTSKTSTECECAETYKMIDMCIIAEIV